MRQNDRFYSAAEIRERLSISTLVFWEHRPIAEDSLAELAHAGIRKIELLESPQQFDMTDSTSMKRIGQACQSCGVAVAAYHCHLTSFADVDTETQRLERVDHCRRQIDTMLELGAVAWGSHADPTDPKVVKSYQQLAQHVEGTDVIIMVENFISPTSLEERMAFLDEMDHPQVKMILDIGHVRNDNGDNPMTLPGGPTRILDICGRRLGHLHLHGLKAGVDHFPPFVAGDTIRWLEIFRKLRQIDYAGLFNFEPAGEPTHQGTLTAVGSAPERIVEMNEHTP